MDVGPLGGDPKPISKCEPALRLCIRGVTDDEHEHYPNEAMSLAVEAEQIIC